MAAPNVLERAMSKVEIEGGCWIWQASTARGYAQFWVEGKVKKAHRVIYELLVGPVPEGLELDHLCRNKNCVNPAHLEPVTRAENLHRGINCPGGSTHCPHGHEYTVENTYRNPRGARVCRECKRIQSAVARRAE